MQKERAMLDGTELLLGGGPFIMLRLCGVGQIYHTYSEDMHHTPQSNHGIAEVISVLVYKCYILRYQGSRNDYMKGGGHDWRAPPTSLQLLPRLARLSTT